MANHGRVPLRNERHGGGGGDLEAETEIEHHPRPVAESPRGPGHSERHQDRRGGQRIAESLPGVVQRGGPARDQRGYVGQDPDDEPDATENAHRDGDSPPHVPGEVGGEGAGGERARLSKAGSGTLQTGSRDVPDHDGNRPASRWSTWGRSGLSSSTGASGSRPSCCMRAAAVLMVNFPGSRRALTSFHSSGMETVAPGSGRTLNGATISWPWRFCRKSRQTLVPRL